MKFRELALLMHKTSRPEKGDRISMPMSTFKALHNGLAKIIEDEMKDFEERCPTVATLKRLTSPGPF